MRFGEAVEWAHSPRWGCRCGPRERGEGTMLGLLAVGNARWPTRNNLATMSSPSRPDLIAAARLIVVKIGSRVLTTPDGLLDTDRIAKIGSQCDRLLAAGKQLVVVSSGAVAAGMGRLGLAQRPRSLPRLQAAAAVGQSCLI